MKYALNILVSIAVVASLLAVAPLRAQNAVQDAATDSGPTDDAALSPPGICTTAVRGEIEILANDLAVFMDQHFQNQEKTSLLLPQAIKKFRLHSREMNELIDKHFPSAGGIAGEQLEGRLACQQNIANALFAQKEILRSHMVANAHAKKTTRLLDSMKEINSKLDTLNQDVGQMYGYMEVFSSKLPCYVETCS